MQRRRRHGEENIHPRRHVDTGGDHGRRVDERADRRRSGHGVRQPNEERNLRRLAGRADEKEKRGNGDDWPTPNESILDRRRPFGHLANGQRAMALRIERPEQQKHAEHETEVADPVDDESFVAGAGVGVVMIPKTDQRVGTQADAFPTDEQQEQAIAQHQRQHRRGEEI